MMSAPTMVWMADDGMWVGRTNVDASTTRPAGPRNTGEPDMVVAGKPGRRVVSAMAMPLLGAWWVFWPAFEGRGEEGAGIS